jgi:prepilin-type N-terminal cleavage/methylation domain-containing protein
MSAAHPLNSPRSRGGFTLVELLVVISVIAILAALITPAYFSVRRSAFEAAVASDLAQLDGAVEKFRDKFGFYPSDFSEFVRADGTALDFTDVIPNSGGVTVQQRLLQFLAKISPTHSEQTPEPVDTTETRLEHWWHVVGKRLATDDTVPTATKEARLRGPQYALWFWLTQLHNDAQYPLTGQRLGTTNADSDGDGIADWADFTSQRDVFCDFGAEQLELVFTLNYPDENAGGNSLFPVLRSIQRNGDGPVVYFHHDSYVETVANNLALATAIDFFPGSAVPNFAKPVRVPGSALVDGKFLSPTSFQIIVPGWDESFGNIDSLVATDLYPTYDNLASFTEGRLDAYVDRYQNP